MIQEYGDRHGIAWSNETIGDAEISGKRQGME
jgi:hypothetical protein